MILTVPGIDDLLGRTRRDPSPRGSTRLDRRSHDHALSAEPAGFLPGLSTPQPRATYHALLYGIAPTLVSYLKCTEGDRHHDSALSGSGSDHATYNDELAICRLYGIHRVRSSNHRHTLWWRCHTNSRQPASKAERLVRRPRSPCHLSASTLRRIRTCLYLPLAPGRTYPKQLALGLLVELEWFPMGNRRHSPHRRGYRCHRRHIDFRRCRRRRYSQHTSSADHG